MSSERIIQQVLDFVSEKGRLPIVDEPGLEGVMSEAIKKFGSLDTVFIMAGLINEPTSFSQPKTKKRLRKNEKSFVDTKRKFRDYPKEYFLNLLNIQQHNSGYSNCDGMPKWWEKNAGKTYSCCLCNDVIQKTERYIAQKTLTPGRKGIYGYRGTYNTSYFHIICLLKKAKEETHNEIEKLNQKIERHKKTIFNLRYEIEEKNKHIKIFRKEIENETLDFKTSSRWRKLKKAIGYKITVRKLNETILQLQKRIKDIEHIEIPTNNREANVALNKKNRLQHHLTKIDLEIWKIEGLTR
ncbi:MAG: hypothetical protein ACOWW1_00370 [archaeon]